MAIRLKWLMELADFHMSLQIEVTRPVEVEKIVVEDKPKLKIMEKRWSDHDKGESEKSSENLQRASSL